MLKTCFIGVFYSKIDIYHFNLFLCNNTGNNLVSNTNSYKNKRAWEWDRIWFEKFFFHPIISRSLHYIYVKFSDIET